MAEADGFRVATTEVDQAGRSACDLADALRDVRNKWDGSTSDGAQACGLAETGEAYTAMQDAWFGEIGVHITLLEDLCENLRKAAGVYSGVEEGNVRKLDPGAHGGQ